MKRDDVKTLLERYVPSRYSLGEIGSQAGNECDVVILGQSGTSALDYREITEAATAMCQFQRACVDGGASVFFLDIHRHIVMARADLAVHCLYYPSAFYLSLWEPLSFAAYLYERGRFVTMKPAYLAGMRDAYVRQDQVGSRPFVSDLARHTYSAVSYYLYGVVGSVEQIRVLECVERMARSLRFLCMELLRAPADNSPSVLAFDWEDVLRMSDTNRGGCAEMIKLLRSVRTRTCVRGDAAVMNELLAAVCEAASIIASRIGVAACK